MKTTAAFFIVALMSASSSSEAQEQCPSTWKCFPTTTAPTIDGKLDEWADIEGIETSLTATFTKSEYMPGNLSSFKCLYDTSNIYLALSIPGMFRFNSTNNKQCAAIATMQKIGVDATFYNMGGCPDALPGNSCNATVLDMCDTHRVDIGAHWELRCVE